VFKSLITLILESQARRLLKKRKPKIVAVTGSVGKTSTKLAIASVLSQRYKVLAQYGSYNTPIGLPMAIFNMAMPQELRSLSAWFKIFMEREKRLRQAYPYDVLVLELGADKLGDIAYFKKYVTPDIAVVTAVAPEHMATFGNLDNVAAEELSVTHFAKMSLINRDNIDGVFAKLVADGTALSTYGTSGIAEYRYRIDDYTPGGGYQGVFVSPEYGEIPAKLSLVGEHSIRAAVAAGAAGAKMGLTSSQIKAGLEAIRPVHGRMNALRGLKSSTLIDDTYNSSPLAAVAALQTLYLFPAKQRIAILGSMNELGTYSPEAHKIVGEACDSGLLDWVITIGAEAQTYLAPAAKAKGCQVRSFTSPYDAGAFAHQVLQRGAVVLAKGSQNGVFAEEALKELLHSTQEESLLVRQGADWLAIKEQQFGKFK
jgi:UDP-N-acetylmuramoyl-tripeptide--D-alanyl-D-alanine ligase